MDVRQFSAAGCWKPRRDSFQLSRPVRKGETIDFFVSHSWSDNPARKWRALQVVADEFFRLLAVAVGHRR